jgi:hypothetical protein
MAEDDPSAHSYAAALRAAISASGLSLEGIARRLAVRGSKLTVGTLSHWQSGRTSPGRRDSLLAVSHLEEVLGLERGTLLDLVRPGYGRGRPVRESRMTPVGAPTGHAERVRTLMAQLDTSSDAKLIRISQHDRLRVARDRSQESLVVKQVLRATHDGPDRFVIVFWNDQVERVPQIRALRGCSVGRTVTDLPAKAILAELVFARPLVRGETVVTEHEFVGVTPPPAGTRDCYGRTLRHQVRECLIEVDFHPDARPVRCEEVFVPHHDAGVQSRRPLAIDDAGHAHAVAVGLGPGAFEVHWSWPTMNYTTDDH